MQGHFFGWTNDVKICKSFVQLDYLILMGNGLGQNYWTIRQDQTGSKCRGFRHHKQHELRQRTPKGIFTRLFNCLIPRIAALQIYANAAGSCIHRFQCTKLLCAMCSVQSYSSELFAKLCQSIFQRQIALYSPGWLSSSRFVTINSTSIKPSIKVRNLTYYIFG